MWRELIEKVKQINLWRDKPWLALISGGVLANFSVWLVLALKVKPSVYPIPLHYNIYHVIDVIDLWYNVFVIPAFGLFLLVVNLIISSLFYRRHHFIAYLIMINNLVVQVLLIVACVIIIRII